MTFRLLRIACGLCLPLLLVTSAAAEHRFGYLDENQPYAPHLKFPKLTTPMWIGEPDVDAVVILAIDDMRDPAKYEAYLRPILQRLKAIDGRAPVSIMTNSVRSEDPQLQAWLDEGLNIDVHTVDHPCPLLHGGDFAKARSTCDRCVDALKTIPNNNPVAFRMPCCDSLNTVSPRFFAEIFNPRTAKGNSLRIDSSVFQFFTSNDPDIPRELVQDENGHDRILKYMPKDRGFVNYIENYPYPYVIHDFCWQFPCLAPSDWSAQHLHGTNNAITLTDWKAALDITVVKQGVLCLVFHPHGWIRNDQVVDFIDHAVSKHKGRVRFLNFREAASCMQENFLAGDSLRDPQSTTTPVRVVDVNNDGFMDVVHTARQQTRVWKNAASRWETVPLPAELKTNDARELQFFDSARAGARRVSVVRRKKEDVSVRQFENGNWRASPSEAAAFHAVQPRAIFVHDLDEDGVSEFIVQTAKKADPIVLKYQDGELTTLPFAFPVPAQGWAKMRLLDLNRDGFTDIIADGDAGELRSWLFDTGDAKPGWVAAKQVKAPPLKNADGSDSGLFVHGTGLYWQNENTDKLPHLVHHVDFQEFVPQATRPVSAAASLKQLYVREGFDVQLVAAEPVTQDPVAFDWDADGRLWVAEMSDYPLGKDGRGRPGGRIRLLEDSRPEDGIVSYDQSSVFLDDVPFPNGVMAWKNGVLVSAAPDIFYAEDTNGDGRADKREVLFSGFGEGNQQHRANGFAWGLDNWIYVANGDSDGKIRSLKTGRVLDIRGHDLRIRPDTGDMECVTGRSQFGRRQDDAGNWFGCNNSNPIWHNVLPARYQNRNPHIAGPNPIVHLPVVRGNSPVFPRSRTLERFNDFHTANRFTSACSAMIYRGELYGESFRNNAFICEPVHNLVNRMVLKSNGATFVARRAADEQDREFLASSDNWFRPVFVRNGPDGALWVADMYRHVIEHPEWIPADWQKRLDLRAGHDRGRIYRIVPVDKQNPTQTFDDPLQQLASENGYVRDMGQKRLVGASSVDSATVDRIREYTRSAENEKVRLQALRTLDGLHKLQQADVLRMLQDHSPTVRRHAIRLSEQFAKSEDVFVALQNLSRDQAADVRLQLALSLGEFSTFENGQAIGNLLRDFGEDGWIRAACLSSLTAENLSAAASAALNNGAGDNGAGQADVRDALITMAIATNNGRVLSGLLNGMQQSKANRVASAELANRVFSIAGRRGADDILKSLVSSESWQELRIWAREAAQKNEQASSVAAAFLVNAEMSTAADQFLPTLGEWLNANRSPQIRDAVLSRLAEFSNPEIAEALLKCWKTAPPQLRDGILRTLISRQSWSNKLLGAIANGQIAKVEVSAAIRQQLQQSPDAVQRKRAGKLFSSAQADGSKQTLIDKLLPQVKKGDGVAGRQVFAKRCSACHQLDGLGKRIGADLAALKDRSTASLLTAIVDPNRAVEAKFISYSAVDTNGRVHAGMILSETASSVTLVASDGKQSPLLRSEIDELSSTRKSLMPEGLERDMAPRELANVIAFLQSQNSKPKSFPGNQPQLVRAEDNRLRLTARNCRIYGPSLVFEAHYGNLGFWSSPEDYAAWDIEVEAAGTYRCIAHYACPNASENQLRVRVAGQKLTRGVNSTGSWDNYRDFELGEVRLEPGNYSLIVDSAGAINQYLIDLKHVELIRADETCGCSGSIAAESNRSPFVDGFPAASGQE